jgi:hypothetical protein
LTETVRHRRRADRRLMLCAKLVYWPIAGKAFVEEALHALPLHLSSVDVALAIDGNVMERIFSETSENL